MSRLNLNIKDNLLASDTEATGIVPYGDRKRWGFEPARPFAFSFCDSEGNTDYIRWEVDPKTRKVIPNEKDLKTLKEIYGNPRLTHIGHNFSYDIRMLKFTGIEIKGRVEDTLIMSHVVTGGSELTYALKPLAEKYLKVPATDEADLKESTQRARRKYKKLGYPIATKELFGRQPDKADFWMADRKLCRKYAVMDSVRTMMFYKMWYPELQENPQLMEIYRKEMRLTKVVFGMEERGIRVFPEDLKRLHDFYTDYKNKQMIVANKNGGKDLNFRSHKQMVQKFFVERGHTPTKLTSSNNPSINGEVLLELSGKDPLARAILEHKAADHVITAFLNVYQKHRIEESPGTWVVHPSYRQCGPVTGRFAASDPNLMTVASETTGRRKSEVTQRPREAFGPRDGHVLYFPDYSQIEVWVFAFLAREEAMMKVLLQGHDFHGAVAEKVWGKEPTYKTNQKYFRKRAKLLMFCKLYGGGVKKVAYLTDSSYEQALRFVQEYDAELPGVNRFMKRMINRVQREGKIVNAFGRHYYMQPDFAYKAVNYIVQGTSADILKGAMLNVDHLFRTRWKGCRLLLTLHDELSIEVPLKLHSKKLMREIVKAMQGDFHTRIGCPKPLPVSMSIAKHRWAKTKKVDLC